MAEIRINPETKQMETLTPEGIWSASALTQQVGALGKEVGLLSDAQAQTAKNKDIQNLTALTSPTALTLPGGDVDIQKGGERIRINSNQLSQKMAEGWTVAPPELTPEATAALSDTTAQTPEQKAITAKQTEVDAADKQITGYIAELDAYKTKISAESQGLIDSIKAQAISRRNAMMEINQREKQTMETLGIRLGVSRYSPVLATNIISATEQAGMLKLAQIDADEAKLIMEAKKAQTKEEYGALHDKMVLIKDLRDQKDKQLVEMQKEALKKSEEITKLKTARERQSNIADAVNQLKGFGITDPLAIINSINYDFGTGQKITDYAPEEVDKVLDMIKTSTAITDKKRVDDTQAFFQDKSVGEKITAKDYLEAQRNWIAQAGSGADFKMAFPVESLLDKSELDKLPASVFKPETIGAANTLDDLAKLGYTRRHSEGLGWDFFKDGKPITAEQISKETGVAINTLLAGSDNPVDIAKNLTATTISPDLQKGLVEDIKAGFQLDQLISAYPEVSASYISSLKWNLGF